MSLSFQSIRWNAHVCRLDICLYSHPKKLWGMESEPMLILLEKFPQLEGCEEGQAMNENKIKTAVLKARTKVNTGHLCHSLNTW